MRNGLPLLCALALSGAGAWAQSAPSLSDALQTCAGMPDDTARLRCFDKIVPKSEDAAPAPEPAAVPAPVPAASQAPAPPTVPAAAAGTFGSEQLPAETKADEAREEERLTAVVTNVAYDYARHFTVTLDNGQVWKQLTSDSDKARFPGQGTTTVTIARGIFGSYNLTIGKGSRIYKVRRIK